MIDATNPVLIPKSANQTEMLNVANVSLVVDLTRMFAEHGRTTKVQAQSRTTFGDLRGGPLVLLGAYNNYWTLKMTAPLRFHFMNNPDMSMFWIEDRQAPQMKDWSSDVTPGVRIVKDYALIARFVPSSTGQTIYVIAVAAPQHGRRSEAAALSTTAGPGDESGRGRGTKQEYRDGDSDRSRERGYR